MKLLKNQIAVYENATIFGFPSIASSSPSERVSNGSRGKILGLSKSSVRRLREALAVYYIPYYNCVGVTLTVPWKKQFPELYEVYRASFNRFCVAFRRSFPTSGGIFRHELQQRKMPHCHMVLWLPRFDPKEIYSLWLKACPLRDGRLLSWMKYGVDIKNIDALPGVMRYLADHASKHKQSQLGYIGKQWGFLGRSNLSERPRKLYNLSFPERVFLDRQLSRVYRYCKKADCVFGYKHLSRRVVRKVGFFRKSTVVRVLEFLSAQRLGYSPSCAQKKFLIQYSQLLKKGNTT